MDLENMRSMGIRSLQLWCSCGHHAVVNVDSYPGSYEVPAMKRFFRCSECGKRPSESRPNGAEMHRETYGSNMVITEKRGPVRV
jgi:hypothetical protein